MTPVVPRADFGPMIVETDIDRAAVKNLRLWLPTYLSWAEKKRGLKPGLLARPRPESYQNTLEDDKFPDAALPAILVTTAQTEADAEFGTDACYYAVWRCVVTAVVRGEVPAQTREVASVFGGCVRLIMVQHALGLGGGETKWKRGRVAPVADASDGGRHLAASISQFSVYVDRVLQAGVGPIEPDDGTGYEDLAAVGAVTIDVDGASATVTEATEE